MALWMSENSEINFMDGKLFASLLDNFLCRLKSLLCQILFPAIGQFDFNSNLSRNHLMLFDFKAGQVVRWEGGGLVAPPLLLQRVNSWTGHTAEEAPTNIFSQDFRSLSNFWKATIIANF